VPSIRFGAIAGCGRYLRYVDGLVVNQKRIYAVMKAADLRVKSNPKLRAKRKADTKKPKPTRPNEWWGSQGFLNREHYSCCPPDNAAGSRSRSAARRVTSSACSMRRLASAAGRGRY
jgi:hypothetical protein